MAWHGMAWHHTSTSRFTSNITHISFEVHTRNEGSFGILLSRERTRQRFASGPVCSHHTLPTQCNMEHGPVHGHATNHVVRPCSLFLPDALWSLPVKCVKPRVKSGAPNSLALPCLALPCLSCSLQLPSHPEGIHSLPINHHMLLTCTYMYICTHGKGGEGVRFAAFALMRRASVPSHMLHFLQPADNCVLGVRNEIHTSTHP